MTTATRQQDRPTVESLRRKSLEALDYFQARESVVGCAKFPMGADLARALEPVYTREAVEGLQRETRDGAAFLDESGDPDLRATGEATESVDRASLGGALTGRELLEVAESIEVLGRARSAFARSAAAAPTLAAIAVDIPDLTDVQRQVRSKIGVRGEVLDSATPTLGALRRHVRIAYRQAVEAVERVMRSQSGMEALQDQVISVRSDRLVLQVKTELRHRIPGIVHDVSRSDATLYVEPFATVNACNAWRELSIEEDQETRRALFELSELVGAVAEDIRLGMRLTARLDFIMARARYSASLRGVALPVVAPPEGGGQPVRLVNARHPLLGRGAVPISVSIEPDSPVLVITGPNTGGKTVAMKTIGLLALLHQSGLFVSADEGSSLPVFDGVYADVGDQQSIAGSVSTFSSHMSNVIEILGRATEESLTLLDELGTSTDPEEGSALAMATLASLAEVGAKSVATTHHRAVAEFAEASYGMSNASVDLDPDTLIPTYALKMGEPGRSYAMSVAARLGMPPQIMERAKSFLDPRRMSYEDRLEELERRRQRFEALTLEAESARRESESAARALERERRDLLSRREEVFSEIKAEMGARFEAVERGLRRAESALSWDAPSGEPVDYEAIKRARAALQAAEADLAEVAWEPPADAARDAPAEPRPIRVGDVVRLRGLNVEGAVHSVDDTNEEATVIVGDARFTLDVARISHVDDGEQPDSGGAPRQEPSPASRVRYDYEPTATSEELHVRGMRAEEAAQSVEEFLDRALRNGASAVRIVHGKGRGVLRQAVADTLERSALVGSYRLAPRNEGGDGVTVAELT